MIFDCRRARIAVEIIGNQHGTPSGREYDLKRDHFMNGYGILVLHIRNIDVDTDFDAVCKYIDKEIQKRLLKW